MVIEIRGQQPSLFLPAVFYCFAPRIMFSSFAFTMQDTVYKTAPSGVYIFLFCKEQFHQNKHVDEKNAFQMLDNLFPAKGKWV